MASLASEFAKRWQEEQQPTCKIPAVNILLYTPFTVHLNSSQGQRLTPPIRRAFVSTLRTPVLLGMFAKDTASMLLAQAAMKYLAVLEPTLMMPELLERAYGGLESVNETHRTTAVLSMLSFIVQPLVNEKIYLGGQKHIIPLLELCTPGIDLASTLKNQHYVC
jgi:proteasome activator subunit 4